MFDLLAGIPAKSIIIPLALVLLVVLERLFPVVHWAGGLWRMGRNIGLALFNAAAAPLIIIPLTMLSAWLLLSKPRAAKQPTKPTQSPS